MIEHTPGPWYWINGEYDCGWPCTTDGCPGHDNGIPETLYPVGMSIYSESVEGDIEGWVADARLIAAAPDLLEACKNEVMEIANLAMMVDPELVNELMDSVYAAIAKAEAE